MQQGCVPAAGAVPPDLPDRDFNMITDSFNKLMEELAQGLSLHQQRCLRGQSGTAQVRAPDFASVFGQTADLSLCWKQPRCRLLH